MFSVSRAPSWRAQPALLQCNMAYMQCNNLIVKGFCCTAQKIFARNFRFPILLPETTS